MFLGASNNFNLTFRTDYYHKPTPSYGYAKDPYDYSHRGYVPHHEPPPPPPPPPPPAPKPHHNKEHKKNFVCIYVKC